MLPGVGESCPNGCPATLQVITIGVFHALRERGGGGGGGAHNNCMQ